MSFCVDLVSEDSFYENITLGLTKVLEADPRVCNVTVERRMPCDRVALSTWEQRHSTSLPDDLRHFYASTDGFNLKWKYKYSVCRSTGSVIPILSKLHRSGKLMSRVCRQIMDKQDSEVSVLCGIFPISVKGFFSKTPALGRKKIHQKRYIEQLLYKFNMHNANSNNIPVDPHTTLEKSTKDPDKHSGMKISAEAIKTKLLDMSWDFEVNSENAFIAQKQRDLQKISNGPYLK